MTPKQLLAEIKAHLKRSGEKQYPFGQRVMHDKAFVWKLKNMGRVPTPETVTKIMRAVNASKPKGTGHGKGAKA